MSNQAQYATAAVAVTGVVGGVYCAYKSYQLMSKARLPRAEDWRQVGTLKDIYVYPIKSCGSVKLERGECTLLGLKDGWLRDRILMVVDKKNNFVTARTYPEMLLVHPTVRSCILTLKHADADPIHVNLAEVIALQKPETATVWGVEVPVYDCGREVSQWLSKLIDNSSDNFKLVYYSSQNSRIIRTNKGNQLYANFTKDDTGALPDEVPYNLINEASVDDLNGRLKDCKVTPYNFRPNFVLSGVAKPYEEDDWKFIKIGENVFEILKPCTRCVLTTIDPETGVRNAKTEPLETLRTYRLCDDPVIRKAAGNSPRMGLQMSLRSGHGGLVSLNDPIYVA